MTDDPYADPVLYDLEYADYSEDIDHYVQLARRVTGPVLELACGSGRITVPLARAGVRVDGLDASAPMLERLERKLRKEDDAVRMRVRYQQGDFLSLDGGPRYPLVLLPFNALHHCEHHRDVLTLLDGIRGVLLPGGRLALDCYLPDPVLYQRKKGERHEERDFLDPRTHEILHSWEEGWYDPLTQVHHVLYVYRGRGGNETRCHLRLRMFFPQELRALLDWAGWEIETEACDFSGRPMHARALKWVLTLTPK